MLINLRFDPSSDAALELSWDDDRGVPVAVIGRYGLERQSVVQALAVLEGGEEMRTFFTAHGYDYGELQAAQAEEMAARSAATTSSDDGGGC